MPDSIVRDESANLFDRNQLVQSIQTSGVDAATAMSLATRLQGDTVANGGTVPQGRSTGPAGETDGGSVSTITTSPSDLVLQPGTRSVAAPKRRGNISTALGDFMSAQNSVFTRVAPYVRCSAEPSGRTRFGVDVPGDPEEIGLTAADLRVVEDRVADTNALIDLQALGVDRFGNLILLEDWAEKVDTYYLGTALAVASPLGFLKTSVETHKLSNGGVITITVRAWIIYTFCFDDKATERVKELLTRTLLPTAISGQLGIPLFAATVLSLARLGVAYQDFISDFFGPGGFYLTVPNGVITPRF